MTTEGAEKPKQCHKCFLQYSAFAPEGPQVRTRGRQTCPRCHLTSSRPWPYRTNMLRRPCIVMALNKAANEAIPNSPQQKHSVPGRKKDVAEKHKATRQVYSYRMENHTNPGPSPAGEAVVPGSPFEIGAPHFTFGPPVAAYIQYCILKMWPPFWFLAPPAAKSWRRTCTNPKVDWYLKVWKGVKKNSNTHWEPVERWKNHTAALLNSSKNCELRNFVKPKINSQENCEGIDDLMCKSYKIKSLLHKLPLNRAAGKDGTFAEHIFMVIRVCATTWVVFNVCLMHRKNPQVYMKTVIVPFCKSKNGDISDAGNCRPVSFATVISKLFEHYILSCISPYFATTDNQFGFKP